MNIRRWLPRRGPLIVVTLAITAAALLSPAPASASVSNTFCFLSSVSGPLASASGGTVSASAVVTCSAISGFPSITLSVSLIRNGAVVGSNTAVGSFGASAAAVAACVPGTYSASAWATIWYPPGNIPASDSFHWQSPSVSIPCTVAPVPLAVANPGNQFSYLYDPGAVQLTVTGGTAPYTWSATGLPTGVSINASTGLISGTLTRTGSYTVTARAVDATGRSGSAQFTWAVRREPCPTC